MHVQLSSCNEPNTYSTIINVYEESGCSQPNTWYIVVAKILAKVIVIDIRVSFVNHSKEEVFAT